MTLHLQMPSQVNNMSPRILVVGVGGAGGNIINSMKESGVEGVEFLNVNTDSQQLKHSKVEKTLQLGPSCPWDWVLVLILRWERNQQTK